MQTADYIHDPRIPTANLERLARAVGALVPPSFVVESVRRKLLVERIIARMRHGKTASCPKT